MEDAILVELLTDEEVSKTFKYDDIDSALARYNSLLEWDKTKSVELSVVTKKVLKTFNR